MTKKHPVKKFERGKLVVFGGKEYRIGGSKWDKETECWIYSAYPIVGYIWEHELGEATKEEIK